MKYLLIISLVHSLTISAYSQAFEYAMTESELAGAKIHDILVVGDRIYLGGAEKDEGRPILIVFDTSGILVRFQTFSPDKPDRNYGFITHLSYDSVHQLIIASAYVGLGCDLGGSWIYQWQINDNLEKVSEFEFLLNGEFNGYDPNIRFSDSLMAISIEGKTLLYDRNLEIVMEVLLPGTLSDPDVILYQNHIIVFEAYARSSLHKLDTTGQILVIEPVAQFIQIDLVGGNLITSSADGQVRIYDANSLRQIDSISDPGFTEIEFSKINDQQLEIAFHQKDGASKYALYDLNLNLIQSIPFTTRYERNIQSTTDDEGNLFQVSSYYKINVTGRSEQGLIPVLRRININSESSQNYPELVIVDVNIINPTTFDNCFSFDDNYFCSYPFYHLHYTFTVDNKGDQSITNFGHYVGSVLPSYCGYLYQDYRYYTGFTLAPGQQMTIADSVRLGWVADAPKLNFYVVSPNHLITDDTGTVYTVEDVSSSVVLKTAPQPAVLYPNPAEDFISVGYDGNTALLDGKVEIWSMTGQILDMEFNSDNQINVSGLTPGMYFLRLIDGKKIFLGSFIKTD